MLRERERQIIDLHWLSAPHSARHDALNDGENGTETVLVEGGASGRSGIGGDEVVDILNDQRQING